MCCGVLCAAVQLVSLPLAQYRLRIMCTLTLLHSFLLLLASL